MMTVLGLKVKFLGIFLLLTLNHVFANPIIGRANYELIILHNNDMHARFDQQNAANTDCKEQDVLDKKCFGGFARVAHIVRQYRAGSDNVLFLNAGDTYTGSPWFSLFKDEITTELMNILQPDAISLGNHEFDLGVEGIVPFLTEVNFPVLDCNLDLTKTPAMADLPSLKPSTVFTKGDKKIGIIGYLTPETKFLVSAMTVEFYEEIESINKEAERLKTEENVDIIIALGHSGIEEDQRIGMNCPLVDVVIGGHSHTFLSDDETDGPETIYGPYPIVVTQESGKKVPIVQSYAFTKYLGYLKLDFDENGDLLSWEGQPILLNDTVPQDADVLTVLDKYRPEVEQYAQTIIGSSTVILRGDNCRKTECNLGNFIADAMVYMRSVEYIPGEDKYWTDAAIGLIQGGGVRASIDPVSNGDGTITRGELDTVLPFQGELLIIELTGAVLKEALEHSVSRYNKATGVAEFLQVSGIHVVYDLRKDPGNRIESVEVLCADCEIPIYEEVIDTKTYNVIVSDFLREGGDGFTMFASANEVGHLLNNDIESVQQYLTKLSPVYPPVEARVQLRENFKLVVLHNNDMHARFDQQNSANKDCNELEAVDNKCFGGFARVAHVVREHRETTDNILFLNAGDTYMGSPWYVLFKDSITTELLNALQPDAISLGNHEFDLGVSGLVPFLEHVNFPVLGANLDLSKTPEMASLPSLKPSTVFTKDDHKIGVIGYLTPDTKFLVPAMTVEFYEEIESINKEAERLKSEENVDIIIALGHSGIEKDQSIAMNCPLVDVVIGGHSHTFLSADEPVGPETPYGPYPIVVTQESGKEVLVVQSYAFTKYLGYLDLEFDENGDLMSWNGEPILLNESIPQDGDVLQALEKYREGVSKYSETPVGTSKVILDSETCHLGECNLGNLIADAYVYVRSLQYVPDSNNHWTDAAISLIWNKEIQSSIDKISNGDGTITRGDLEAVLPNENNLFIVEVAGAVLKDVLEMSVLTYEKDKGSEQFFQVSGLHVTFDVRKEKSQRIESLEVLCADCDIPIYEEVEDTKNYNVIISEYLKNNFISFENAKVVAQVFLNDIDSVQEYLTKRSPVHTPVEWRIQVKALANILVLSATLILTSIFVSFKNVI